MLKNLRKLIEYPDPILRQKSSDVVNFNAEVQNLIAEMLEIMYNSNGIGLAAVQIGVLQKVIVIDIDKSIIEHFQAHQREHHHADKDGCKHQHELRLLHGGKPLILINPRITWASEELFEYEEGCLSLPGLYGSIKRPAMIKLEYQNPQGESQFLEAQNLLSTCIQHEIDHTEGKVFPDRASSQLKKEKMLHKYDKERKQRHKKPN